MTAAVCLELIYPCPDFLNSVVIWLRCVVEEMASVEFVCINAKWRPPSIMCYTQRIVKLFDMLGRFDVSYVW